MTKNTKFEIVHNPTDEDIKFVKDELQNFVDSFFPPENIRNVNIILKDKSSNIVGGIICRTTYRIFVVDTLWIDENYRGKGLGTLLLSSAEIKAKEMGCTIAMTGTFEAFGARQFYQNHGFEIVSTSKDSPPGETGYWFHKKL